MCSEPELHTTPQAPSPNSSPSLDTHATIFQGAIALPSATDTTLNKTTRKLKYGVKRSHFKKCRQIFLEL